MKLSMLRSPWNWGAKSKKKLDFLHDDLYFFLTTLLHYYSPTDISIVQVLRSIEEHEENLRTGKSNAKVSRHLGRYMKSLPKFPRNRQNYPLQGVLISHAVDIVAWRGGRSRIEEADYLAIAEAASIVAKKLDIPVRWGGCWRDLRTVKCVKTALEKYKVKCMEDYKAGRRKTPDPFYDLGHYELSAKYYPATLDLKDAA